MDFGKNLRMYRRERDLTQAQLAEMVGVAHNTIAGYEKGDREPSYQTLEAIADVLNVSIDALMGKDESENEIDGVLEFLKNTEEGRILFSKLKGATRQDLLRAASIIEALRKHE